MKYYPPVNLLLSYGECQYVGDWPNYLALGLTLDHVPELIQMVIDEELNHGKSTHLDVWAPVHAWRTLAQLRATAAIEPLIQFLMTNYDDDWVCNELPTVLSRIGEAAIKPLTKNLDDESIEIVPRICFSEAIAKIGLTYPETRMTCINILTSILSRFEENDPSLNGLIINDLVDLHAIDSFEIIKEAYNRECVDLQILGNLAVVEKKFGFKGLFL
ncbi:HEAT repeat domain-containing protein [candidate division KSB1 bacterium]|nr:HEAT repeat domain-containing protein [candidate division KSB1 bacterium]